MTEGPTPRLDQTSPAEKTDTEQAIPHVAPDRLAGLGPIRRLYAKAWRHALSGTPADPTPPLESGPRWPKTWQQFLWDLAPERVAPNKDGIVEPDWEAPHWVAGVPDAEVQRMLDITRTTRRDAEDTVRNLELKASRLATTLVALLTATIALVVFEISRLGPDPSGTRILLFIFGFGFALPAAGFLVVALNRAVDADQRMGITSRAGLGDIAHNPRTALEDEAIGYAISDWTRKNKASRVLDARAALTRAQVCILISAALAIALAVTSNFDTPASQAPTNDEVPSDVQTPPTTNPSPLPSARPNPSLTQQKPRPTKGPTAPGRRVADEPCGNR